MAATDSVGPGRPKAPGAASGFLVDPGDRAAWRAWLVAGTATAVFAAWLWVGAPGTDAGQAASNLAELLASGFAAWACIGAGRHTSLPRARRIWWLIGLGCAAWAVGQLVWTVEQTVWGWTDPFPSWGDAGFAIAAVMWLAGLFVAAGRREHHGWPARLLLDGFIVGGGVFLASWMLLLQPLTTDTPPEWVAAALTFFYPAADIALVTVLVLLVAEGSVLSQRSMVVLGSGFAVLAVADSGFVLTELNGDVSSVVSDVAWFGGLMLVALAGLDASRHPDRSSHRNDEVGLFSLLIPYAPVVIAMGVAAVRGVARPDSSDAVVFWVTLTLFAVILLRQVLVLRDNQAVNRSLHRALDDASHAALHDSLTGLANRAMLMAVMARDVERTRRSGQSFALVFLDLDDFKRVNDTYGHHVGDAVLREVAARLTRVSRRTDIVARLGGDEFVVLLDPVDSESDADTIAQRHLDVLMPVMHLEGHDLSIRASMGLVVGTGDEAAEDLLTVADHRMYQNKAERHRSHP